MRARTRLGPIIHIGKENHWAGNILRQTKSQPHWPIYAPPAILTSYVYVQITRLGSKKVIRVGSSPSKEKNFVFSSSSYRMERGRHPHPKLPRKAPLIEMQRPAGRGDTSHCEVSF